MTVVKAIVGGAPDVDVAGSVAAAVVALLERDTFLFQADVNERSITHCLALHLAPRFPEWHVDCEYNRDGFDPKMLDWSGEDEASETDGSRIYPDILVHHRGKPENLLVIEVKKSTSSRTDESDLSKLRLLRQQLRYQHALFLRFRCGVVGPVLERVVWI